MLKAKRNRKPKTGATVYCGPSVKGIVKRDTVFSGEMPRALSELLEREPLLKELTVDVESFAAVKKSLSEKGSRLSIIFAQAEKRLSKTESKGGK